MSVSRECEVCGANFTAVRPNARYCCDAHRARARRERLKDAAEAAVVVAEAVTAQRSWDDPGGFVTRATLAELTAAKREGSADGLAAMALARRIDYPDREGGSALAALVREHSRSLARALAAAAVDDGDFVDELERKREERRRAGNSG